VLVLAPDVPQIPGECGAMIDVFADGTGRHAVAGGRWSPTVRLDQADLRLNEHVGRAMACVTLALADGGQEIPRAVRLLDLLNIADADDLLPPPRWRDVPANAWHPNVPIGQTANGVPVHLDLREHHHGPHGIIAGATGAGKSELLQGIIAAVAVTHASDRAQFLLIDFKGGASLRVFKELPHTVGLVTDLQGSLAERAITAIKSEIRRRKELLNSVDVKDIADYRGLPQPPEPLANLLIVIDEFDEMVKEQPDFVTELIRVVKQGRSLGVHLLLATQQPGRSVKDEIKTQLQYFVALRLGSADDSREMLQRPDAFFLPTDIPGRAYFRVGTELTLFQTGRISGPYRPQSAQADQGAVFEIDATGTWQPLSTPQQAASTDAERTDLDVVVEQLVAAGESYLATRPAIWQPPLPRRLTLAQVLPPDVVEAIQHERWWSTPPDDRWVQLPVGLLDVPQESRQEPLVLDLNGGNVLIAGAPGSGKTVLLRSLLLSLGLTHTPGDAWCYVIDAGGQGLNALRDLPHIGGIVEVREIDKVRRVVWMMQRFLEERQAKFRHANAADLQGYRQETGEALPAIVFIIDKFASFREEHEEQIDDIIALARAGRAYGIHLVITTDRPNDIPYRLFGLLEQRYVLRMADEGDAVNLTSKCTAAQLPADAAGRGLRLHGELGWLEFHVALPYVAHDTVLDDSDDEDAGSNLLDAEINARLRATAEQLNATWQATPDAGQHTAPGVQLLPDSIGFDEVWQRPGVAHEDGVLSALVGVEDQHLQAAHFALGPSQPALLLVGGPRSGKTAALRTLLLSVVKRCGPDEVQLALVAPRATSFQPLRKLPHVVGMATNETELRTLAHQINTALDGNNAAKHMVVCIDDWELCLSLMSGQFSKPLAGVPANGTTFVQVLERIVSMGGERGVSLLIAANINALPTGILAQLDAGRSGMVLRPSEFQPGTYFLGLKLPIKLPGGKPPLGRAIMVVEGVQQWVQVAQVDAATINQVIADAPPRSVPFPLVHDGASVQQPSLSNGKIAASSNTPVSTAGGNAQADASQNGGAAPIPAPTNGAVPASVLPSVAAIMQAYTPVAADQQPGDKPINTHNQGDDQQLAPPAQADEQTPVMDEAPPAHEAHTRNDALVSHNDVVQTHAPQPTGVSVPFEQSTARVTHNDVVKATASNTTTTTGSGENHTQAAAPAADQQDQPQYGNRRVNNGHPAFVPTAQPQARNVGASNGKHVHHASPSPRPNGNGTRQLARTGKALGQQVVAQWTAWRKRKQGEGADNDPHG